MDNFRDSYFPVDWDLTSRRLRGTFWGKQYDTGRGFAVTVINGGQVVTATNEVLRLKWEKPDKTTGYVNATIVDGKFIVENIDQMFTVQGRVRADFELSVGGESLASITFYVSVEKAVAVDAIESSSDFTALQEALADVDDVQAQVDAVIANATVDSEVILARGTEPTLGARLDGTDAQLAVIMNDPSKKILPATNMVLNGNLTSSQNWSSIVGGSLSVSGGYGTFKATQRYGRFKSVSFTPPIGRVIYAKARIKTNSNLVGLTNKFDNITYHSGSGEFEDVDMVWKVTGSADNSLAIVDARDSGWENVSFGYVIAIDLTETFGVENIPSRAEVRDYLSKYENNWFDGTVDGFAIVHKQDEALIQLINEVEKIANISLVENEIAHEQTTSINIPKVDLNEPLRYGIKGDSQRNDIAKTISDTIISSIAIAPFSGEVVKTITLPSPLNLKGISDDTRDELRWDGRIIRNVGVIQFDGTQTWDIIQTTGDFTRFRYLGLRHQAKPPFRCSHYPFDDANYNDLYNPLGSCVRRFQETGQMFLSLKTDTGITTVDQLNAFLASENAAGRPLTIYYQKAKYASAIDKYEPISTEEVITLDVLNPIEYGKLSVNTTQGIPQISIYRLGNVVPKYSDLDELVDIHLLKQRDEILEVTGRAKKKQSYDTLTFGFVTDTHREMETTLSMSLLAEASKSIGMKFLCHGGDIIDGKTPKDLELAKISKAFARSSTTNTPFFFVKGNHDDNNWYARTIANTNLLADYISPKELYNHTMKLFEDEVNIGSKEGLYYYFDDENSKIRTVFVNTHKIPFEENPDGTAKFNAHDHDAFGNEQLNWIAHEALDFSEKANASEWATLFIGHMVGQSSIVDNTVFVGILNAYKNGSTYRRTGTTIVGDYSVDVDFSTQGTGDVIALLNGDMHMDAMYPLQGFKGIVTLHASARPETCWDIFTVDRSTRTIYATRYGAGEDRVTTY